MKNKLTSQQYQTLQPFEDHLKTALEGGYTKHIPRPQLTTLYTIYQQITGTTKNANLSCSRCVLNILKTLAETYFSHTPQQTQHEKENPQNNRKEALEL